MHWPCSQVTVSLHCGWQTLPQPPQLLVSLVRSTQVPPHSASGQAQLAPVLLPDVETELVDPDPALVVLPWVVEPEPLEPMAALAEVDELVDDDFGELKQPASKSTLNHATRRSFMCTLPVMRVGCRGEKKASHYFCRRLNPLRA